MPILFVAKLHLSNPACQTLLQVVHAKQSLSFVVFWSCLDTMVVHQKVEFLSCQQDASPASPDSTSIGYLVALVQVAVLQLRWIMTTSSNPLRKTKGESLRHIALSWTIESINHALVDIALVHEVAKAHDRGWCLLRLATGASRGRWSARSILARWRAPTSNRRRGSTVRASTGSLVMKCGVTRAAVVRVISW